MHFPALLSLKWNERRLEKLCGSPLFFGPSKRFCHVSTCRVSKPANNHLRQYLGLDIVSCHDVPDRSQGRRHHFVVVVPETTKRQGLQPNGPVCDVILSVCNKQSPTNQKCHAEKYGPFFVCKKWGNRTIPFVQLSQKYFTANMKNLSVLRSPHLPPPIPVLPPYFYSPGLVLIQCQVLKTWKCLILSQTIDTSRSVSSSIFSGISGSLLYCLLSNPFFQFTHARNRVWDLFIPIKGLD